MISTADQVCNRRGDTNLTASSPGVKGVISTKDPAQVMEVIGNDGNARIKVTEGSAGISATKLRDK